MNLCHEEPDAVVPHVRIRGGPGRATARGYPRPATFPALHRQPGPMLAHERLIVYQRSIEFLSFGLGLLDRVPRGFASASDQLRRAAMSIPLCVAEGVGKVSVADRRNYLAVARGSAMECGALMDVFAIIKACSEEERERGKRMLVEIVSMLSGMLRR